MKAQGGPEMVLTLTLLAGLCGFLLLAVHQATAPVIAAKREAALRDALKEVKPQADRFEVASQAQGLRLFRALGAEGQLLGWVVEAQGMGYQEPIRLIYGLDAAAETLQGYAVLESKETPGLGDRIETDRSFLANFERLPLENPLEYVPPGGKEHPWQVEGITGATVSSKAVVRIVNASLKTRLPQVRP